MESSQTKHTPKPNPGQLRVCVTGGSGCGKSSFINAIRGLDDDDEGAASTGVVETTTEEMHLSHPKDPMIWFTDLPSVGTPRFPDVESFFEKFDMDSYDVILILTSSRFTQNDLLMAKKMESIGKPYFFVRTKVDSDIISERRKKGFDEVKVLEQIKSECLRFVNGSENQVFLISSYRRDKWDFQRLATAIYATLADDRREVLISSIAKAIGAEGDESEEETKEEEAKKKESKIERKKTEQIDETPDLTEEYMADAREYMDKNGVSGIREILTNKLNRWKNVQIRFGITGSSGTGKSTFINAIRGLQDDDYDSANVGVIETTRVRTNYRLPYNAMIVLVDLPGIGTPEYPDLKTYCRKVKLECYDTFLIFTATRFTAHDLELAKIVKWLGKSFFLIRSKIDVELMPKPGKAIIDEEAKLEEMRNDCIRNVRGMISSEDQVFLIGSYDKEKWDFDRLVKAIAEALPSLQRESLILSLSNLTRGCLRRKTNYLKALAVTVAGISAGNGAIPLPGRRAVLDAALIKDTIADYYRQFGIPDLTSDNFERFHEFEDVLRRYNFRSNDEVISSLEFEALGARKVQDVSKYIPIVGTIVAGSISFSLTLHYLLRCVNELEELALAVLDEAANKNKSI